jgi:hydrogenase maturation protease
VIFVGGVGQLYLGDLDVGRHAAERLAAEQLGPDVIVDDLYYGAVAVAQRIEELSLDALVLVGAVDRGREPGTVVRRRINEVSLTPVEQQGAMHDAGTGYVSLDLVVEVAWGLAVLPARTVVIEIEPARTEPAEDLTPAVSRALEEALALTRGEIRRIPVLQVADEIRQLLTGRRLERTPAVDAVTRLLDELQTVDREGRWAGTFGARDQLRACIATGATGEGMNHLDWSLWWTLIEALERLQQQEAIDA